MQLYFLNTISNCTIDYVGFPATFYVSLGTHRLIESHRICLDSINIKQ